MPKSQIFLRFGRIIDLHFFHLQTAQDGQRGPQDRPNIAQVASKMAPGRPKMPPRCPQNCFRRRQTGQERRNTAKRAPKKPPKAKRGPRRPREACEKLQKCPKKLPRGLLLLLLLLSLLPLLILPLIIPQVFPPEEFPQRLGEHIVR